MTMMPESAVLSPRKPWLAGLLSLLSGPVAFAYVGRLSWVLVLWPLQLAVLWLVGRMGWIHSIAGFFALLAMMAVISVFAFVYPPRRAWVLRRQAMLPRWYNRWYHYLWIAALTMAWGYWLSGHRAQWFGYETFRVPSANMQPALRPNDFVLSDARAQTLAQLRRHDVVVYRSNTPPQQTRVGRLIGLPGDTIEIDGNQVRIDGRELAEPYLAADLQVLPIEPLRMRLDADQYFILGDNRPNSEDSRFQGPFAHRNLLGRLSLVWFATDPSRIGAIAGLSQGARAAPVLASANRSPLQDR